MLDETQLARTARTAQHHNNFTYLRREGVVCRPDERISHAIFVLVNDFAPTKHGARTRIIQATINHKNGWVKSARVLG